MEPENIEPDPMVAILERLQSCPICGSQLWTRGMSRICSEHGMFRLSVGRNADGSGEFSYSLYPNQ